MPVLTKTVLAGIMLSPIRSSHRRTYIIPSTVDREMIAIKDNCDFD